MWCIRSSVVNKWVLYANPFLRFEQESSFLSFRKPSNNVMNYGYRTPVKAERTWITEERDRILSKLRAIEHVDNAKERLQQIYAQVADRIEVATKREKRFVLECLSSRVCVWSDKVDVEISVPEDVASSVSATPWCCTWGPAWIPLRPPCTTAIVSR